MAVYLVRQQSSAVLLQRLRAKGIRNPDHSRALSKFNVILLDAVKSSLVVGIQHRVFEE